MHLDDDRLAAAVLDSVARAARGSLVWEAGSAQAGCIRVVYRTDADAPLIGRRFDVGRLRNLFAPNTPEALAQVILDELLDPTDPGPLHDPEQDAHLVPGMGRVGWWPSP
ncbi:hypothetical protein ROT00_04540 [Agromyces mediolanus]|uniref:hypothetical protein n=1 Tax=Agromyces mediolanus TaxID=41986 RepID=UPI003838F195